MFSDTRAAIVIPAFNEELGIGPVIEAAQAANPGIHMVEDVIVVNNNSTDETAAIATSMGAIVVPCEKQGKAPALARGVEQARELGAAVITYVDADLIGLTGRHFDVLTNPVIDQSAGMTIGYLGERTEFAKHWIYRHWAMFCGQRSLPLEVWDKLSPRDLKSFRVEAALNSLFRNSGRGDEITRIELDGVSHVGKFEKYPTLVSAWRQYAKIEMSAIYGLSSTSRL